MSKVETDRIDSSPGVLRRETAAAGRGERVPLWMRAAAVARAKLLRRTRGIGPDARGALYREIWGEAAHELGGELVELATGFFEIRVGERTTHVHESLVMLDHPATVAFARNKSLVYARLTQQGLPTPAFREFDLDEPAPALSFLRASGGPCVVKPGRNRAGGDGVTTQIRSAGQLAWAAIYASWFSRKIVIERQVEGDCYRLLYLDGVLLDALRRRPPAVTGDGTSTIRALIGRENARRRRVRGTAGNRRITITPDCRNTLRAAGLRLGSVPSAGAEVVVKTATNEASERDSESVRARIAPALVEEGARAAAALGIRFAGIDVVTGDAGRSLAESGGKIIDVNASPGLQYHYQTRNGDHRVAVAVPLLRRILERDVR